MSEMKVPKPVELDHNNRPVPANETPETVIQVWDVQRVPAGDYDHLVVRGWQAMLDLVRDEVESYLDGAGPAESADGVQVTVKLRDMTREEYDDIQED